MVIVMPITVRHLSVGKILVQYQIGYSYDVLLLSVAIKLMMGWYAKAFIVKKRTVV
jgi:hypothetical protein